MNREKYEALVKFHPKVGDKLRVDGGWDGTFSPARVEEITTRHIVASGPTLGTDREFDRITLKNKGGRTIQAWTEEDDLYVEWCGATISVRWAIDALSANFESATRPALNEKRADKVVTKERMGRLEAMVDAFRVSFRAELTRAEEE
jgi:hypothetical protein